MIQTLQTLCPTSVKVLFRNLKFGQDMSLGDCLQMEYRLALRLIDGKNFKEGLITFSLNLVQLFDYDLI